MRKLLLTALALLLAQGSAPATESCGPRCQSSRECPRREYTRLHYWTPTLFLVRAHLHPSCLNQYPPGPAQGVSAIVEITRFRCPGIPPTPSAPYADPASYYGRPIAPP